jgi:predicted ATP-dependent protease
VPINQSIAVTGSVNQRGYIQPIGGVNEKIEGYYKVCKLKGLNNEQGVIIPIQNVKNLMLEQEVVDAVRNGTFHIWAISHVDEGLEILTGRKTGKRTKDGSYEKGTIYYLVDQRLQHLAKDARIRATHDKQYDGDDKAPEKRKSKKTDKTVGE